MFISSAHSTVVLVLSEAVRMVTAGLAVPRTSAGRVGPTLCARWSLLRLAASPYPLGGVAPPADRQRLPPESKSRPHVVHALGAQDVRVRDSLSAGRAAASPSGAAGATRSADPLAAALRARAPCGARQAVGASSRTLSRRSRSSADSDRVDLREKPRSTRWARARSTSRPIRISRSTHRAAFFAGHLHAHHSHRSSPSGGGRRPIGCSTRPSSPHGRCRCAAPPWQSSRTLSLQATVWSGELGGRTITQLTLADGGVREHTQRPPERARVRCRGSVCRPGR